jgi:DNA-binding XRE family transcriptional regulator
VTNNVQLFSRPSPRSNEQRVIERTFYIPPSYEEMDGLTSHTEFLKELAKEGFDGLIRSGRKNLGLLFQADLPSLKALRLQAGFSQQELADAAGLKQYQISRYEAGKDRPSATAIEKLKKCLAVDLATLWAACGYES